MPPCDLVGNGSRTSENAGPIVVGVDGRFAAIRAARWAAAVAARIGAPLRIVHAKPALGHNPSDVIADPRLPRWLPSGNPPRPYLPPLNTPCMDSSRIFELPPPRHTARRRGAGVKTVLGVLRQRGHDQRFLGRGSRRGDSVALCPWRGRR
jgi:hypothetical protein